jgi:hypothetical protein
MKQIDRFFVVSIGGEVQERAFRSAVEVAKNYKISLHGLRSSNGNYTTRDKTITVKRVEVVRMRARGNAGNLQKK